MVKTGGQNSLILGLLLIECRKTQQIQQTSSLNKLAKIWYNINIQRSELVKLRLPQAPAKNIYNFSWNY